MSETSKKETMKDIILKLHQGLSAEAAKNRFETEIGVVTSTEIAEIEQSLIDDGLAPEEIKKFCNVHALIFQSALEQAATSETAPSHPIYLFKLENREIEKLTVRIRTVAAAGRTAEPASVKAELLPLLEQLKSIDVHFVRKEQLFFPYLEKHGFMGPSKVMWGKHNEIRDLMKASSAVLAAVSTGTSLTAYIDGHLNPLLAEVDGMIYKEENILFPASLEKLLPSDWVAILKESDDIGYVFIKRPQETDHMVRELRAALIEEPVLKEGSLSLPTGALGLNEVMGMLNTLPLDITFVDKNDNVQYFSDGKDRIFRRTRAIIGRNVQNCHPPQSIDAVNRILASFKDGSRDSYEFWITLQGRFVHIRYFAIRDADRTYLGTMEVTQDVTPIRQLEGQKRLVDGRD
jgi:DUF438 domain-containing protein